MNTGRTASEPGATRSLAAILADLESVEVFVAVSVSSSSADFYRRIAMQPETRELQTVLFTDPDQAAYLLRYVEDLVPQFTGPYRHPSEIALCAALLALGTVADSSVDAVLRRVTGSSELALKWPAAIAGRVSTGRDQTTEALTEFASRLWSAARLSLIPAADIDSSVGPYAQTARVALTDG